jgi:RHS repeat-associated protein
MWRWDNVDPFGANAAVEDPGGAGSFAYALRFPGQYYDSETGTHYNYFRDFDPTIGRYTQSDPIGLDGGMNAYSYANDPLTRMDPLGLMGRGSGAFMSRPVPPAPRVRPDGQPWGWGCGDATSDRFVPDSVDGVSFTAACRNHDVCYDKCGANKADCDKGLYNDIVSACFASAHGVGLCLLAARGYYAAMSSRASQSAFNKAQRNCQGCP